MEHPAPSSPSEEPPSKRLKTSPPPQNLALGDFSQESGLFGTLYESLGKRAPNEEEVGVTEFVGGDIASFQGIIKHRFTDFLVYEVDMNGQVVRLKEMRQPMQPQKKVEKVEAAAGPPASTPTEGTENGATGTEKEVVPVVPKSTELWTDTSSTVFAPFLSPESLESFKSFILRGPPNRNMPKDKRPVFTTPVIDEKDQRTAFHRALREHFDSKFISEAKELKVVPVPEVAKVEPAEVDVKEVESSGGTEVKTAEVEVKAPEVKEVAKEEVKPSQVIEVVWKVGGQKDERVAKSDRRLKASAPGYLPPYIHFTLQKTNKEQHDALGTLARLFHVQTRDMGTSGTKDKRAITVQKVSMKRGTKTIEDVWRVANGAGGGGRGRGRGRGGGRGGFGGSGGLDRGMRIGDFEYKDRPLRLAELKGNRFVITLRDVQVDSPTTITSSLESLKNHGFINYYGMQRFGTAVVPTHAIGLALLRSDWELATHLILAEREGDIDDVKLARILWKEGKLEEAAKAMPRRCVAEKAVLDHFAYTKKTTDHLSALSRIPKNLRMMYVHAWQSYIWNRVTSERIKLFGSKLPVAGDLVYVDGEGGAEEGDEVEEVAEAPAESLDPNLDDDEPVVTAEKAVRHSNVAKARPLTQDDIDSGKYTIFDVVLPLPGFAVVYPTGSLGETYREIMRSDKIDPDELFRKQREYSLGGAYRKILHLPSDVVSKLLISSSPTEDLAQSDEDRLLTRPLPGGVPFNFVTDSLPLPAEKSLALQIEITLGSSTYATMALREILKSRTSGAHQKSLTVAMEGKFGVVPRDGVAEEVVATD